MTWSLATGAGKDSTLALHRARAEGLKVSHAFNVFEGNSGQVRFHGTPVELVRAHADALGLELVTGRTHPEDFETVFNAGLLQLRERGVEGLVFGNIHLADVRSWYEERVRAAGLLYQEPLWGGVPGALVREFVEAGFRAVVVSVNLQRGLPEWLGRELATDWIEEVEAHGADPCGEHGEYHTFVFDGPGFRAPVAFERGRVTEREGHALLHLEPAPRSF